MMRILADFLKMMYARMSLYSVILLFSTVPSAGTMLTCALASRMALYWRVRLSSSVWRSAVKRGWLTPAHFWEIEQRRTRQEGRPMASRDIRAAATGKRLSGICLIVEAAFGRFNARA